MSERKWCRFHLIFFIFLFSTLGWPWLATKAQEIRVVEEIEEGYHLKIDGEDYLALPVARMKAKQFTLDSLNIELRATGRKIQARDTLIAALEKSNATYEKNFAIQDSLMAQVRSLYRGYRDLYFEYKTAYSEPWLYFSGGIGAVRDQSQNHDLLPVFLLGLSIKRFTVWGFLNSTQSGFLMGVNSPIHFHLPFF